MLERAEELRRQESVLTSRAEKSRLGQFMTPSTIATFMAGLFGPAAESIRLLDAGAGLGALSCAFVEEIVGRGGPRMPEMHVVAYEADERLGMHLPTLFDGYDVETTVCLGDFIEAGTEMVLRGLRPYTHAILNPPYKKIGTNSRHRLELRRAGIETVNLYSGFIALAIELLKDGGELVAIVPRSFCNGPYYRPFRARLLEKTAICRMHLFDSRDRAFRDDSVLQETIILHLKRGASQKEVVVSRSTDDAFEDMSTLVLPFASVVDPDDPEQFIHVPTASVDSALRHSLKRPQALAELGLSVSTGPIVDFRLKGLLRNTLERNAVPLIYPETVRGLVVEWPPERARKPRAIILNENSSRWMFPNGWYTIVKRFSAKEERRRVVASAIDPGGFAGSSLIGIENHLNVFHMARTPLSEELAKGLATFLNTTAVDEHFRRFAGHTQVNATDLRNLKYPDAETLARLGRWAMGAPEYTQRAIDAAFAQC